MGFKGGSYGLLAARYKEILARDHVNLVLRNTVGGAEHFKLLQDKKSGVQAAMVQGGISDDEKSPGLLSLGRINYQIFCIFYRADDSLNDLTELKGKTHRRGASRQCRSGRCRKGSHNQRCHI